MRFIKRKKPSEATIQAILYNKLIENNINAYTQYKHNNCIFDIVVVNDNNTEIILIIEVKSYKSPKTKPPRNSKQYKKYRQFNVPVIFCTHLNNIQKTVDETIDILNAYLTTKKLNKKN